jgi:hypothetical protein
MMEEASITINDRQLSTAQAMAVRVAVSDFYAEMQDPDALGDDEHGRAMTKAYRERIAEVIEFMVD